MTKQRPNNLSAEAALIGSILYDNRKFYDVRDIVDAESFYAGGHEQIWSVIADKIGAGSVADGVTLREHFDKSGDLAAIGGPQYLAELLDSAAFGPEVQDYARIVADMAQRRALMDAAETLANQAAESNSQTALDAHDKTLEGIRDRSGISHAIESLPSLTLASLDNREAMAGNLLATGYPSIDSEIGGFERGAMTVLGARPGMGKTAFAVCAVGNLLRAGHTVGFFSLEMPSRDIGLRLGCWEAWQANTGTVPFFSDVKQGRAHDVMLDRVRSSLSQPHVERLLVDDRGALTLNQMRRRVRDWKRHARRMGWPAPSVIVVDHMGHARPDDKAIGRYEKITEVSNGLLAMSKEFDVAVVALCQLNRASVQGRRRPSLEDLRDSGAIEQDASTVLLLHREDYYLEKDAREGDDEAADKLRQVKGQAELIIAKARNGPTGSVLLSHSVGHNVFRDPMWADRRAAA